MQEQHHLHEQQHQDNNATAAAQQVLHRFLLQRDRNRRAEAKAWLVDTLADVHEVPAAARHDVLLPWRSSSVLASSYTTSSSSSSSSRSAELQLLLLLADAQPAAVSGLLLSDAAWLRHHLTASPRRINTWFGGFEVAGGIRSFRYGARALANFALAERATTWHLLVWRGRHAQSPVAVAAKPHYFGELDVGATIANLARSCPRFWDSEELRQSCEQAPHACLALDADAAAQELQRLLHEPRSSRCEPLRRRLSSFLAAADWGLLCRRLLPLLPGDSLLQAARILAAHLLQQREQRHAGGSSRTPRGRLPHMQWLSAHTAFVQRQAGGGGTQSLADAAAATAASRLPCVADLTLLLLQGTSSTSEHAAAGCWTTVDALLLANALTVQRGRLLQLLLADEEDEDAVAALATVTAAAASVARAWAQQGRLPGAGVDQRSCSTAHRGAQSPSGLLQLLLEGWLLRVQLMLDLAAAAAQEAAAMRAEKQLQQAQPAAGVFLPQGWSCVWCSSSSSSRSGGGSGGGGRGNQGTGGALKKARRSRSRSRSGTRERRHHSSTSSRRSWKRARHRSDSSNGSSSGSDLDLDGGGQLLDPADFDRVPLPPGASPSKPSPPSTTHDAEAGRGLALTLRSSLSAAYAPTCTWLACLPAGGAAPAAAATVISVRGTSAETADALAWHAVFLSCIT